MSSRDARFCVCTLALLALASVYFYDVLSGAYLLTERDLRVFFIPPRFLWVELVKSGTFPLWNPYHLNGHPLFATLQAGVFYPPNILYFFLPFDLAFNYIIVIHYFLAGFFTFLLLRGLRASYSASLISAVTFMLSGYLLSVHNLLTHLLSVAWVPLVFLLFLKGLQGRQRWYTTNLKFVDYQCSLNQRGETSLSTTITGGGLKLNPPHPNPLPKGERKGAWVTGGGLKYIIFSALAACVMFLGGGVEIVYCTLVVVCLLTFSWRVPPLFGRQRGETSLPTLTKLGYLGIFIAVFLGLSAVQLLPFMELSAHSIRSGGISYKEATLWSMHPKDLLQFFLPDLYGYALHPEKYWDEQNWLKTIYLGAIPFLLSIFFFIVPSFSGRQRWYTTNLKFVDYQGSLIPAIWGNPAIAGNQRGKTSLSTLWEMVSVRVILLLIMAGSLILAFGGHTPIYFYLYEYVPFFNKIRYPVKFLFLTTIVISVTAGLGYDRLMSNEQRAMSNEAQRSLLSTRCSLLILSFFTALAFGGLDFFEAGISSFLKSKGFDAPTYNDLFVNIHNMKRLLCITTIFGLVVFVGLKRGAAKKFLPSAILLLLTIDLFFAVQGFYHKTLSETYHGKSSNMDFILSDKSLFRIFTTPKTTKGDTFVVVPTQPKETDFINVELEKVSPGLNIERHIFDTWGSEVMIIKRIQNLYNLITTAPKADSTNLLSLMNVKYVISMPKIESNELKLVKMNVPATEDQLDDLEKGKTIKVYQNLHCLPRAFLVKDYKVVSSEEEYKNIMQGKEFNPSELLLLDEEPVIHQNQKYEQKKIVEKVEITRYNANTISLQADVAEPKFLFMSETYCPGWKAYIDGEKTHIYRANYAFRALFLETGEHEIKFVYDPWTFKLGLIISIITIVGVSFLFVRIK